MDTQFMKVGNKAPSQGKIGLFTFGLLSAGIFAFVSFFLAPFFLFLLAIVLKDSVDLISIPPLQLIVGVLLYPLLYALPLVEILLFLGFVIMAIKKVQRKNPIFLIGFLVLAIPVFIFTTTLAARDTLFHCYTGPIGFYHGLGGGGACPREEAAVWWRMGLAK